MHRLSRLERLNYFKSLRTETNNKSDINNINRYKTSSLKITKTNSTALNKTEYTNQTQALYKIDSLKTSTSFLNYTFNPITIRNSSQTTATESKIGEQDKSSNVAIISVSTDKGLDEKELKVNVKSIAAQQINQSMPTYSNALYNSDNLSSATSTEYIFKLETGSSSKDISIQIDKNDILRDVFNKISTAINSSGANVKADLLSSFNNSISLRLTSTNAGENSKFNLTDVKGELTSKLGLNNIKQKPTDTVYTVDGKEFKTNSNKVWLADNSIQVELLNTGEANVNINISDYKNKVNINKENIIENIQDNLDACNQLGKNLEVFYNKSKAQLSSLGIKLNSDNKLTFDKDFLRSQLKNNIDTVTNSMITKNGGLDFFNSASKNILSAPPKASTNTNTYLRNSYTQQASSFSRSF